MASWRKNGSKYSSRLVGDPNRHGDINVMVRGGKRKGFWNVALQSMERLRARMIAAGHEYIEIGIVCVRYS